MSWRFGKLEQIASVKGGKRLPKGHNFSPNPTEHLYIRARDIGDNKITLSEPVYITDNTFSKLKNYVVEKGDLVVTIVGANIGDVGYITSEFGGANLTENAAKVSVNAKICNPKFLSAQLSSPLAKKKFQFIAAGCAQGKLGLYKIKDFDVLLPPLSVQEELADVLTAYTDLFENNRRRIQLLEQAARLLYKEWFVHLRFPGHQHVKIKDGVPERWERRPLGEVATLRYGKALKEDDRIPGPFSVYGSSGVVGTHEKPLVQGPGIVVGRKGNVGSVYWSQEDFHPIDTVYFINREQSNLYLYYTLLNTVFISTDVAVPGLNREFAHSRNLLIPEAKLKTFFEDLVTPIHKLIHVMKKYSEVLAKARDLLLPRLMNGEIAV